MENSMKEMYTKPEVEIVIFDAEDVITTSGGEHDIDVGEDNDF